MGTFVLARAEQASSNGASAELNPTAIRQISSQSLRGEALRIIRAAIIAGDIPPGQIHSAPALARLLDVSPTPVREAMLDLVAEGLVEPVRNRGFRVVVFSKHDLEEILQLQLIIEPEMTAASIGKVPAQVANELRHLADATVTGVLSGDLPLFIESEREFHRRIVLCSGNGRAADILARMRDQIRRYGIISPDDRQVLLLKTAQEHAEILDAVMAGDAELTRELVAGHLARGTIFYRREDGGQQLPV